MSADTPATRAAAESGIDHQVLTYRRATSITEAAELRGVTMASIVKTLVVRHGENDYVLVCLSGDRSISWPKLRSVLGVSRAAMADPDQLASITGYERGAVTPFGTRHPWPVIVDEAVAAQSEVSLGGGAHGVAINLAGSELVVGTEATVADVSKGP